LPSLVRVLLYFDNITRRMGNCIQTKQSVEWLRPEQTMEWQVDRAQSARYLCTNAFSPIQSYAEVYCNIEAVPAGARPGSLSWFLLSCRNGSILCLAACPAACAVNYLLLAIHDGCQFVNFLYTPVFVSHEEKRKFRTLL